MEGGLLPIGRIFLSIVQDIHMPYIALSGAVTSASTVYGKASTAQLPEQILAYTPCAME